MTESPNASPLTQPLTPDPIRIGAQFLKQFYHNLTHTPTNLHRFYSQSSNATNNISHASTPPYDQPISPASLSSSPDFCWAEGGRIDVSTVDAQCTSLCLGANSGEVGILLVVTGSLAKKIEEGSGASGGARFGESRMFVHTFHLCPVGGAGSKKNYCIGNDVFRFVAGTETHTSVDVKEPVVVVVAPVPELKKEPEIMPVTPPETTTSTTKKSGRNKKENKKSTKAAESKQKLASGSTSTAAAPSAKPISKPVKPIKPIAVPLKDDSKAEKIVKPPPQAPLQPAVEDSKRAKPKAASTPAPAPPPPPETVVAKKPAGPVSWANRVSGSSAPAASGPSTKQSKPRSKKQSSTEKQKSKKVITGDEVDNEVDAATTKTTPAPAAAASSSAATTARRASPPMGGALYGGSSLYIRNVPEGVRAHKTEQTPSKKQSSSSTEKQKSKKVSTTGDEVDNAEVTVTDAANSKPAPTAVASTTATARRASPPMGGALYGGSSLYIRNVPEGVRATDIRKLFEPYETAENGGYPIANVSAPSSRGYAFVDYRDPTAASAILKRAVKPPQSLPIATGKSNNNGNSVIFSLANGSGRMVDLIAEEKNRGVNNNNNQSNGNAGFNAGGAGGRRRYNNRGGGNEKGDDASKQRHFRGNQNNGGRSGQYNNRRGGSGGGGNNGGNNNTAAAAGTSTNTSNTAGGGGK
eukprot:CAMPEP_0194393186 /NCGR_PEP_ID=MMETSP0174-20130528/123159_1 /TAXON_ID=216777 /ORGANISM="Proboscia alata, Strain PI-D3" /LENGTH=693 /DNA_ID=CAMNT_0039188845 /DNA_START=878 /DNA_END=2960 /DNA_ORIENTATION=+